jgi:hypothetical protein
MQNIIEKLNQLDNRNEWKSWSLREKKQMLEFYLMICKKENHLFDLVYRFHECDSWEDIFRDYDMGYLEDKIRGVEIAIENIEEREERERINEI